MIVSHQSNRPLRVWGALQRRHQQALGQRPEVESPVKLKFFPKKSEFSL
jgi:hypothetical protein